MRFSTTRSCHQNVLCMLITTSTWLQLLNRSVCFLDVFFESSWSNRREPGPQSHSAGEMRLRLRSNLKKKKKKNSLHQTENEVWLCFPAADKWRWGVFVLFIKGLIIYLFTSHISLCGPITTTQTHDCHLSLDFISNEEPPSVIRYLRNT